MKMKKSYLILLPGVSIGIVCWMISYLMFKGILMGPYIICGSLCEIWPGIRLPWVGCLAVCVDRNGYYPLFFWIGLVCILFSVGIFIALKTKSIPHLPPLKLRNSLNKLYQNRN